MHQKSFLLTVDWVVNCLHVFNKSEVKDKDMLRKLRYIFRLASKRGLKEQASFLKNICYLNLSASEIRKYTGKLITFVSPEEIKLLLTLLAIMKFFIYKKFSGKEALY